jgi:hypothetical protein
MPRTPEELKRIIKDYISGNSLTIEACGGGALEYVGVYSRKNPVFLMTYSPKTGELFGKLEMNEASTIPSFRELTLALEELVGHIALGRELHQTPLYQIFDM